MWFDTQHMLYFLKGPNLKIVKIGFDFQNMDLYVCLRPKTAIFSFFTKKKLAKNWQHPEMISQRQSTAGVPRRNNVSWIFEIRPRFHRMSLQSVNHRIFA